MRKVTICSTVKRLIGNTNLPLKSLYCIFFEQGLSTNFSILTTIVQNNSPA